MELRHLRYFTAVVQWNGYREAARQRNVAQPALSQAVAELEEELQVKLFVRERRRAWLTPAGEVFHGEALRILEQVERAGEAAQRAARGEIGTLRIGFCGSAVLSFFPELIRSYRERYPGVKLVLHELHPQQQEEAFARGELDIGLTRPLSREQAGSFEMLSLYKEPLIAAVPERSAPEKGAIQLKALEEKPLILFFRPGAPRLYDSIISMCSKAGFAPRVADEPNQMQTALSLVSSGAGVAVLPACVTNLWSGGVRFCRLLPEQEVELVAAWPKATSSVVLRSFLDLLKEERSTILASAATHLASITERSRR